MLIRGHKRSDNTMSKRKRRKERGGKKQEERNRRKERGGKKQEERNRRKGQTMIYKTIHRKLKIEQYEPHEISSLPVDKISKGANKGLLYSFLIHYNI